VSSSDSLWRQRSATTQARTRRRSGRPAERRRCSSPGSGPPANATRRDLSALARILFWALIGLILFGIVAIFVAIPNAALIYAVLGLVIFAGLTAFDFQRLRRSQDIRTAPLLAASIFLDILNVFLLLLSLFGRDD
jgi:FtsH-binding integral membrane protein